MQRFKPQSKTSKSSLKKAAAVFALAAVSFLAGYANWKCDKPKPRPVQESTQRMPKVSEAKAREITAKLEKVLSTAEKKKVEDERKANEVLMKLAEEFPYESLDCKLEPLERPVVDEESDDTTNLQRALGSLMRDMTSIQLTLWNEMRKASAEVSKDLGEFSEEKALMLWCRLGMMGVPGTASREACTTDLIEEIARLKDENNLNGVLALVRYTNSLNLEWPTDIDPFTGKSSEDVLYDNLYMNYHLIYMRAFSEGWEKGPGFACVARNSYALRIARESLDMLTELLSKTPLSLDSVLSQLTEIQQLGVLDGVSYHLFDDERFDRSNVENFFAALSPASKAKFIETLYDLYVNDDEQVSRAEELAKYASDPELRIAMERIAARWKWKVKSIDESMGEEENLSEENDTGEE